MGLILIILVLLLIPFLLAKVVYRAQVNAGKSPWLWSIITFIVTATFVLGGAYYLANAIFER
jgi:hypothetical protein